MKGERLRVGVLEPHLRRYGGIRRMLEFSNRLVDRGHEVTFYVPRTERRGCTWMPCRADVKLIDDGYHDPLDILIFNEEPQWFLLERFVNAERRIFYALHYAGLYQKRSSWEALRAPVDLQLANSAWTAGMIEAETGHRPEVVLSGIDQELFRPYELDRRYPILCTGGDERIWKGTTTVRDAARRLGLTAEEYAPKDLDRPSLAREYSAAEVFAVGSWFEGFGQPGLEALACGTPLVTTDNGGCREYAHDGETAMVVPPRDPEAMAAAIERVRGDRDLAARLVSNGLDMVSQEFDWDRRTDHLESLLAGLVSGPSSPPPPRRADPVAEPVLSIVVLAWENLDYTQACVESIRQNTDTSYELIIVDNGSHRDAADYARLAADVSVGNPTNKGFARGMNQGLAKASGTYVAFCNNDVELPPGWASKLVETAGTHPRAGIVVPALSAAGNPATVRTVPGHSIEVLRPFSPPPSAVVYLMARDLAEELGGWNETYEIASGEDVDLTFTVWVNDLDIVFDERVLVRHEGKATARNLGNWRAIWDRNRRQFLDTWQSADLVVLRREGCDPATFERNKATASAVAEWMDQYFTAQARSRHRLRDIRLMAVRLEDSLRSLARSAELRAPAPLARTAHRLRRRYQSRRSRRG